MRRVAMMTQYGLGRFKLRRDSCEPETPACDVAEPLVCSEHVSATTRHIGRPAMHVVGLTSIYIDSLPDACEVLKRGRALRQLEARSSKPEARSPKPRRQEHRQQACQS